MHDKPVAQERDGWTSMFQPDVLAAAQYMEKWRYQRSHEPEKMLMCAVLEDAITCFHFPEIIASLVVSNTSPVRSTIIRKITPGVSFRFLLDHPIAAFCFVFHNAVTLSLVAGSPTLA